MDLTPTEFAYWESYVQSTVDKPPEDAIVTAGYAGTLELTDELLALYLAGKKKAGSSVVEDFVAAGEPLPIVGNYWIYLDGRGEPACILKTVRIALNKFKDLPEEIAIAEGEGDRSIDYWKRVHGDLYRPFLKSWGVRDVDEATIITEFFEIVFR